MLDGPQDSRVNEDRVRVCARTRTLHLADQRSRWIIETNNPQRELSTAWILTEQAQSFEVIDLCIVFVNKTAITVVTIEFERIVPNIHNVFNRSISPPPPPGQNAQRVCS